MNQISKYHLLIISGLSTLLFLSQMRSCSRKTQLLYKDKQMMETSVKLLKDYKHYNDSTMEVMTYKILTLEKEFDSPSMLLDSLIKKIKKDE